MGGGGLESKLEPLCLIMTKGRFTIKALSIRKATGSHWLRAPSALWAPCLSSATPEIECTTMQFIYGYDLHMNWPLSCPIREDLRA